MRSSRAVILLPLPSLVAWLAVDTAELPRTPVPLCGALLQLTVQLEADSNDT